MTDKMHLRYTNVTELLDKARINFEGKKPHDVYKRLCDMHDKAEKAKLQGDEETQYIMFRRWLDSVVWLKKTHQYKDMSSSLVTKHANQMNEIQGILTDLQQRLDMRYKQLSKGKMRKDGPLRLPETPTKDPLVADNVELISCDELYQLLQKEDSRYLIIDIRPESQYNDSGILSDKCINIPDNEIKTGVIASHLQKYLHKDRRALDLFKHRGAQHVDVVILLDWNTTGKSLAPNKHLSVLYNILKGWDPGINYKRIAILDGGYHEWITRYPAFATNPNTVEPQVNTVLDEMLDDIEYPDWLHSDDEDTMLKTRETKSVNLRPVNKYENTLKHDIKRDKMHLKSKEDKINDNNKSTKSSTFIKPSLSQSVEQIRKNNNNNNNNNNNINNLWQYDNNSKSQHERISSTTKQIELPVKPTIDRSSKPVSLETSSSESKKVLKLMKHLIEVAKNKEKLEVEIFEQESSLRTQHGGKHRSSSEKEYIHGNLKSLYSTLEETQKEYVELEEDVNKYHKIMDTIYFNSEEHLEKSDLTLNLNRINTRIKHLVAEREKLREKSLQKEGNELSTKEDDGNIHKEPLKTDSSLAMKVPNSPLERSYSSPNLLQTVRKAPRVDRSSKPSVSPQNHNGVISNDNVKVSHISWTNREERMAPVHGSVHPGITGLKNLGNSCYMNSIIQCLSNTTHLAKYLTDNLYADDLNTHNDSTTRGQVVEEVAQVIKALWAGQYKSISPRDLKRTVGNYKLQFHSNEQQDSHEFLTFLLDWMHNDLKKEYQIPNDMTVAEKAWDKAMGSRKSIISDLFFGQLRSTITCSVCNQGSTTYETFNSLTTSLPDSNRCTLNDCILKFVTGQKVVGWKCPKCQMSREATKKFDFVKLAPIVVIHLNRFAESGGWLEKRNVAVDFPLTGFDLKPYLVADSNTITISNIRNYNYSLYAMSNHYGTMEAGHYTAYCKNSAQNKWYKYDDQTVTEVNASHVKSQMPNAYLLFYTSFSSNIIQY